MQPKSIVVHIRCGREVQLGEPSPWCWTAGLRRLSLLLLGLLDRPQGLRQGPRDQAGEDQQEHRSRAAREECV
eukprot:CAMPEP_0113828202 /NCGR_PEP_ID=MMETSP0328-20130328/5158_1 /TAXON_ID=39455 /ORGANISM="Alexandrium minutum" /LENGTH=72 /DNA_ID=CAMNT_0000796209 /DNA_START=96 /DNA_END=311 /DNA_ORIENTATION=+ /assembly_acc=CAM_ASM_000350